MLLDAETLRQAAEIHPQVLDFAKANPQPPLNWDNWQGIRANMELLGQQVAAMLGPPESAILEEYKEISMRDGYMSTIKIHKPANPPASGSPLIVAYFGGGWISGDKDISTAAARAYIRLFGATVVAPSYRLAPEHKFPTGQNDSWDTLKWLDEHASEIGADLKQGFIVSGVSAGAVNAAAVATHAIESKLNNPITGQYLCVPSIMDKNNVPERYRSYFLSHEHNKDAPILPTDALRSLAEHTAWDTKSAWRYPILSKAPLSQQPPAYFQIDGMDPLRDEGLIWEEMLKEAGVKTKIDFYPGCPHAHFAFMPGIEVTNKAYADQMVGVGWLLEKTITPEQGLAALAPPTA